MKRGPPPGALRSGPNLAVIEVGLARLEDRVRDLEIGQRAGELDARELRAIRKDLADLKRDTADAALLASALRKVGQHLTRGR